ncbi:glutaminyl-peptide cyclotransferase [Mycolicibacterium doricum]|uniref:Glutaminyl-peptide cyclotransferase n=1 Tax=Mycolicibacterium doricum TaxID=126673 RepID=A0A1X1SX83_9MYCO|nr:glutaminyl-peptide cyclotransferase [Mycolicibacterium doricum]MCV7269413.1 glutaminyl-peptide cyclotransferase [Mycolicibacterium doricum]ORV35607.1 glutaminyl-peptide cyclotransferase [Mycolicibacterium doricum]BBZ07951.1 glutaminyl-peptide cyclotransferase [Mycolicibacterium doricum]
MSVMSGLHVLTSLSVTVVLLAAACADARDAVAAPNAHSELRITVLDEVPHDTSAFTQGLEFDGAALYETTGLAGQSQLRQLDPATGAVRRSTPLPGRYFGEGLTAVGDRIWQVTYRDGVAIEWDAKTFTPAREVPIEGEGWGVCYDGGQIVRSDGTDRLRFVAPADFTEAGSIAVTRPDGEVVTGLNELECVDGQVWANVWPTDEIVRIDPGTGAVTASADCGALRRGEPDVNVLNGIARAGDGTYLITGKNWSTMYRVRFDAA